MPRRKPNPQTTPKAVYLSILKAKRSVCDTAERQRNRTKFMLIECCSMGLKTFPHYVLFTAGTARGRGIQIAIVKKKNVEIARREGR